MRRPVFVKYKLVKSDKSSQLRATDQREAEGWGKLEAKIPRAPIPPSRVKCFLGWNGSGPLSGDQHFGIQLVVSHGWSLSAWHVVWPLARFYSQLVGLASPLPDGVPRFGGAAAILATISIGPVPRTQSAP